MSDLLSTVTQTLGGWKRPDWIALGALIVAAYAAWLGRRSAQIAERAYSLAYNADQRRQGALDVYLVDAYIRPVRDPPRRVYVFGVRVTNRSDVANALKGVSLEIEYGRPGEPPSSLVVQHDKNAASVIGDPRDVLCVPQSVGVRSVTVGLALFPVGDELLRGSRIESTTIFVVDAYDVRVMREALLLREVRNGSTDAEENQDSDQTSRGK